MRSIARFATEKRWLVVVLWLAFIVGAQVLASSAGGAQYKDVFTLPHTQTQTVNDLLNATKQTAQTGQAGYIVVHAKTGALDPSAAPTGLMDALTKLCASGEHVASVAGPWGGFTCSTAGVAVPAANSTSHAEPSGHNPLLSTDNSVAIVNIAWQGGENSSSNFVDVYNTINKLNSPTTEYEFTGPAFANLASVQKGLPPEVIGLIAALIILTIVFRTPGPILLPLLSAAAALGVGIGLISLLTHAMNVADFTTQLSSLMVIGVGVDYALFIITRHRRNLLRGMTVNDSIAVAVDTSGRAVLFAGITVCIAILGLCALGVNFLYGVAVGTSIAVGLTMVASLTLLPAVLSFLGDKVLPRRTRKALRAGTYVDDHHTTRWARWADTVQNNKVVLGLVAAMIIVVLAIPFFSLRLGRADQASDPASSTTRKGYDLITSAPGFGKGYNSNFELVISGPTADNTAGIVADLRNVPNVNPSSIRANPLPGSKTLAFVSFKSISDPQAPATSDLVNTLRGNFTTVHERGTSNKIYVYGQTAIFIDFAHVLSAKMPLFFIAVIGLSFLLLMVAFRSIVIPLTAALMNVFAAGASFGIVVAIFQWGWFSDALGIGAGGPIDAFLPVIFFAILFGLSMDYQVFLVSRMHEEWIHTNDNHRSVRVGQAETGGIITVAALIMISVFASFVLGDSRAVKLIGIGLGGAILIDAFILRTVLVPALMHAIGRPNWYFPKWLDRVTPHLSVDPADHDVESDESGEETDLVPV